MKVAPSTLNLTSTFIQLKDDLSASLEPFTPNYWADLMKGQRPDLDEGRMVMMVESKADWDTWERHPKGDEIVTLISGSVRLHLDKPGGLEVVELATPGDVILVPRGIWHTAKISQPSTMLFITPGRGTEHKPV